MTTVIDRLEQAGYAGCRHDSGVARRILVEGWIWRDIEALFESPVHEVAGRLLEDLLRQLVR